MKELIQKLLHEPLYETIVQLSLYQRVILALSALLFSWIFSILIKRISKMRLIKKYEDPLLSTFIANIFRIIVVIIGMYLAMKIMQLDGIAASMMAGAGISAFIIGFALKDIGENFLAGILLASNRPFRVGDLIECNGIKGVVTSLNLKDTELKTSDGKDVFIPNSMLIKNALLNYTLDDSNRYQFSIKILAGADVLKTKLVIEEVMHNLAAQNNKIHKTSVQLVDISASGYVFSIYYWLYTNADTTSTVIKTNALVQLLSALKSNDIQLQG